jgi:branched-subunit amino acid ABC-type transport system permease component
VGDVIASVLRGASTGSVYALLAMGLVLAYRTTGVFNLAFGPQAFLAAAVYYDMHVTHGQPMWLGLIVSILIVSPLVGLILDRFLFRHLRSASETAKFVSVLGLFVAMPAIIWLWFGSDTKYNGVGVVPNGTVQYHIMKGVTLERDDIALIVIGLGILVGLTLLLRYSPFGLRMRAVVESSRLTELAGVNSDRVSMGAWMLTSGLAGLAGVLVTPLFAGQVKYPFFEALVVAAIAAAVIGSLASIPMAFVGGIALGVTEQLAAKYIPSTSVLATGEVALPFLIALIVLITSPGLARRRAATDPLAGVDPPPPGLAALDRPPLLTTLTRISAVVFLGAVGYWLFFHADANWVDLTNHAAILAVVFLSITVITGFAGQISLCQASFAAIGACATSQLAISQGVSILVAMLIGGLIAALVGVLIAVPSLRLGGIFLALVTLAFAYFFDQALLQLGWISGGTSTDLTPRPKIGPIDFSAPVHNKAFLVLVLVVLTVLSILVIWVRDGTTGRYLDAMRGSEVAATSIGINVARARIIAFAISAAIAGIGGGLYASYTLSASQQNIDLAFTPELGLLFVVLVVTLGSRTVEGAIQAAIGVVFFEAVVLTVWIPWVVNLQPWYHMSPPTAGFQTILFGLGALTYARHPEGILEFQKRRSYARIMQVVHRVRPPKQKLPDVTAVPAGGAK